MANPTATAYRILPAALGHLWRDLGYGLRALRLSPVFTIVAIVSLALGVGANTAIFQLLDAVRLRTLPVKSPKDLVELRIADMTHARGSQLRDNAVTNPLWEQIRRRQQVFSEVFAWADEPFNISPTREYKFARGLWVSGNLFDALGVRPIMGRVFTAADDRRGCGLTGAVISYGFWQREFEGSASTIGRKIRFNNTSVEVIGVTPPGFFGLEVGREFDLALPVCANEVGRLDSGTQWWLTVMGRLNPGTSLAQADAHLKTISHGIFEATLPADYPPVSVKPYLAMKLRAIAASGGRSSLREEYSGVLELLLAIGASRAQLIQQLMIEGLLLAFAGAAAAFFVARGLARFLVAFLNSGGSPVVLDVHPDWRVFAFTASLALLTCVLFALTPALRATRAQPANALSSSNRGTTAGRERFGLRRILVATQVSLSLVLLVGALLFVRSLGNLMTLEPGFKETGILIANVTYGPQDLPDSRLSSMRRNLVERVRAIPGVDAAAETAFVPIDGETWTNTMWMDGSDSSHGHEISRGMVGAGYFRAIGTPLLAGREFDEHDTQASPNVAIVSEAFTRVFSLGPAPVGKKFWIERTPFAAQIVCEIVGVAKDSKYSDLRRDFVPVAFFPMAQSQQRVLSGSILIRSRVRLETLTPLIRRTLAEVSPGILYSFSVFKTQIEDSLLRERLMALLSGLFGALAVLLATVGLYGLISFTVAQRTKEIGIRTALGASRGDVIGLVLRETGVFVAAGIGGGMLLSLMAGRVAASLLFGLEPSDPFTLLAAGTVLAVVALGASVIPARRACAVDAATALRQD